MKILFSIYSEDRELETVELKKTIQLQTDWSVKQIDEHIALFGGFRSEIVIGDKISFFDYFCFYADYNDIIRRIEEIPKTSHAKELKGSPCAFRVEKFNPGAPHEPQYPQNEDYYLFDIDRYECGASSYDAIVYWASTHPFAMMFIGGLVYDFTKWFIKNILKHLGMIRYNSSIRPVVLNTKKLYQNFSKTTNISTKDCQITKINHLKIGVYHVKIRTATGRRFKLRCTAGGAIESLEEIKDIRNELYS